MDGPGRIDADGMIELALTLVAIAFLMPGVALVPRPGRRLAGAALIAAGMLAALLLYVFSNFRLPI